ncbi:MAG: hypothetical protein ACRDD8_04420 [Bacteroidales bacterium]
MALLLAMTMQFQPLGIGFSNDKIARYIALLEQNKVKVESTTNSNNNYYEDDNDTTTSQTYSLVDLKTKFTTDGALKVTYRIKFSEPTIMLIYSDLYIDDELVSSRRDGSLDHGRWMGTWGFTHRLENITTSQAYKMELKSNFGLNEVWYQSFLEEGETIVKEY